ncbi:MAG: hypothetical protein LIO56_07660 [Lachnospiraceae bacterium]|nr:hypothetical protein [Lachnospiraceae bacterium]
MIKEFGMDEQIPGLELTETVIEEDLRFNPNCPCPTRTCSQHGFCKACIVHHKGLRELIKDGVPGPRIEPRGGEYPEDHFVPHCYRVPNERMAARLDDYD